MARSIIIIGAGMGGLAAGIYGQVNGYETQIFEMHTKPGGQCTSWKRQGYTFDGCIHHFFGCSPDFTLYQLWHELGAMPRELVKLKDCTAVVSSDGKKLFVDFYDLKKLRETLLRLSPNDSKAVDEYVRSIEAYPYASVVNSMFGGSFWTMIARFPTLLSVQKWARENMGGYAERFADPFLKRAFALLVYSEPSTPFFFHLLRHAGALHDDVQWPVGGAGAFARSIEQNYLKLGGKMMYGSRVDKILVENDRAVGVRLADGSEHRADIVISNADGRKTILEMLDGKYMNDVVRGYCQPLSDTTPFGVDVFLGVNRDLSGEPSSLVFLLDEPMMMAGQKYEHLEAQIYGFDKTMAPTGKGTIKVELPASYAYWKRLYLEDKERYRQEKQKVADQVIGILDHHYPGLKGQVEAVDVTTLMTWERYMGGSQGWFNLPNRKFDFKIREEKADTKFKTTLPGLSNFYFVGVWATMMGSLFHNAHSGKAIIQRLCREDGRAFRTRSTG